ncbi:FAD-dependent monooxygenase [Nocardiopsis sp. RSe5-2]|uniref:FAD-dependent monooxygenase n=1 Tax=Nocardiopsis endophytica TaxID=3018445 RepID=A0ABT4U3H3_9ACTN|nr:FAD-dependent monooxygenase [Nocardiopsis endophytica]MDA2811251.1 FAD-dependent monooxygenase [Nocardiopsis endophytica]
MARTVCISGAGIAGPALAFWLRGLGLRPTVVEHAPRLRTGGWAVDVRGAALTVAERMGLAEAFRAATDNLRGLDLVDARGRVRAAAGTELTASSPDDLEIRRTLLSRIVFDAAQEGVEYVFGDSVTAADDDGERVRVSFARSAPRDFDLLVAADGLHSNVRRLVFGPEERYLRFLKAHVSIFDLPNRFGLDHRAVLHSDPGRTVGLYAGDPDGPAQAFVAFRSRTEAASRLRDAASRRRYLRARLSGMGWKAPEILEALDATDDLYFDSIAQVHAGSWSKGRTVLLGDAAHCPSPLSGQGSSLALVGAYVLAGELAAAGGDHHRAFPAYEEAMRGFVRRNQAIATNGMSFLVPRDRVQILVRDAAVRAAPYVPALNRLSGGISKAANAIALKDYPLSAASAASAASGR